MTIDEADLAATQRRICEQHDSAYVPADPDSKVGIALASLGKQPVYGLRSHIVGDTCGWYVWAGEYSPADGFFQAACVKHLDTLCPVALKYLGLAPGFGFIADDEGYEDVWFDAARLQRESGGA